MMMATRRRLWIFNHYAEPPDRQATRSFDLGKELTKRGHEVTIFSSSFSHYRFQEEKLLPHQRWKVEEIDGVRFVWLRTTPYRRNDWRRAINMLSYALRAWRVARRRRERPDVIIGVSVHPLAALAAYLVSRATRSRFFFEVTDLWPETLVEFGVLPRAHPLVWLLAAIERFLYRKAERVISLLPNLAAYLAERGIDPGKAVWIPNGVDLSRYETLRGYDGTSRGVFTVMYIGGHVQANALDVILDAASVLQAGGTEQVKFVFVGGGQEKPRMVRRAEALGLRNVEFRDVVPKERLAEVMAEADAFVFSLRNLALYRYGIGLNKMCDYLASGRPIVFAGHSSYNPIADAGAGVTVPPEDPRALAEAIQRLMHLPAEARLRMGTNGVAYVERAHDIKTLASRLEALV